MTHTPGPWWIEYNTDYYHEPEPEDIAQRYVIRIAGADDSTVYYTESGYFKGEPEDVRLIAEAPAMLEALRVLMADPDVTAVMTHEAWEVADAILDRIEG